MQIVTVVLLALAANTRRAVAVLSAALPGPADTWPAGPRVPVISWW